jgi:dTDP-4-amino-4,6-dideoxygalactose transaminase
MVESECKPDENLLLPVPEESIARAVAVLRSGRLYRYLTPPGDTSEASLLEVEFANLVGSRFAVAVNSCGSAMFLALKCTGVKIGDPVLMNAFTLAAVPGAIAHIGARHVLVDITPDLTIDPDDLAAKARVTGGKHLLLSHMRGHIADMPRLVALCRDFDITIIEDCAHTMGASWAGKSTGTFGKVGCFSLQSNKHINAGEGGLIVTDDEDIAAQAILYSGSYMLYEQHCCRPPEHVFRRWRDTTPNFSLRMSNLVAAIARPQLRLLPERALAWNDCYGRIASRLSVIPGIRVPARLQQEEFVQSSIQFTVAGLDERGFDKFVALCKSHGVKFNWYGAREPVGHVSAPGHWHFVGDHQAPAETERQMERLCDMRFPLGLLPEQCERMGDVITSVLTDLVSNRT